MINRASCFYLATAMLVAMLLVSLDSIALQIQLPEQYKNGFNLLLSSPMGIPIMLVMAFAAAGIIFMLLNAKYMRHIVLLYVVGLLLFYGFVRFVQQTDQGVGAPQQQLGNEQTTEPDVPVRLIEDEAVRGWLEQKLSDETPTQDKRLTLSNGVILALTVVILLLIAWPIWQQRRKTVAEELEESPPPLASLAKQQLTQMQVDPACGKTKIINCYQQLLSLLAKEYKMVRHPAQTAQEFYQQLKHAKLPAQSLYQLTLLFEKACYSQLELVNDDVAQAMTYLDEISQGQA